MSSRRRTAAGFTALVALTAALVLGGTVAAIAEDGLEITGPASAAAGNVTITGTQNAEVSGVVVRNGPAVDAPLLCNIAPSADTTWECEAPLETGYRVVSAYQGARTATFGIAVGAFTAPTPSDPSPDVPNGSPAVFSGTVDFPGGPNSYVEVSMPGVPGSCTDTSIGAGGEWQCAIDLPGLGATGGNHDVHITQYDLGGMVSPTTTITLFYGMPLPPTFSITSPTEEQIFDWTPDGIVISGTTPVGDPIDVYLDGEFELCSFSPVSTAWSCGPVPIDLGTHFITAQQPGMPDADVNIEIVLGPPEPDEAGYSYVEGTTVATFSGSGYPGADVTVAIELDDAVTRECAAPIAGESTTWSCQIPIDDLAPGEYNVFFSQEFEGDASMSMSRTLEITGSGPLLTPVLTCTFSPNGGFAASGAQPLDHLELNHILAYGGPGGGSGSTGSGSGGGFGGGGSGGDHSNGGGSSSGGSGDPGTAGFGSNGACGTNTGLPFTPGYLFDYETVPNCSTEGCGVTALAAGDYEVFYLVSDGEAGYDTSGHSFLFRIPAAPPISSVASTTNSVILDGSGAAGDTVRIERPTGAELCTTTVTGAGTWACQFPRSSATSARAIAIDAQSGGMSAFSPERAIPVATTPAPPTTTPTPPQTPSDPVTLVAWFLEFGGDLSNLRPGDSFTLNVSGMPEGTSIEVWMHSTPRLLGTATGTGLPMQMQLTVPEDIENGAHEIEMIAITPLGTHYFFSSDAMVSGGVDPVAEPEEEPEEEPTGEGGGSGGSGGSGDRADPGAPSALSDALPTLERIGANPIAVAVAGGLALALLFLVALPTELLNASLSSNTTRLGRWYGAVDGAATRAQDWFIRVTRSRALAAGLLTIVVAIIYGFVDPNFGFDLVSLRLVLSLAIAFFVLTFVASWVSGLIIRRAWGATGVVSLQPSILVFAVVGVVVSRLLDFSPGILIGIAIGLELIQASRQVSAKAVFVQLAVVTGFALAAWVVYSLFSPAPDFGGMLVEDTMVAITAEGLTGALIAVFPLRFLDGHELWQVSKRLWVLAFLVVGTAFALLVLPTAIEGTEVADYGVWLLVFAAFGLLSLLIWLLFARAAKREEQAETVDADAS
jgi:Beta-propeller domains of methanol dehydrogenase type